MALDVTGFGRTVGRVKRIGVDTAVWIYHLEDVSPYSALTLELLSLAASGRVLFMISTVSVAEILAGPWRTGDADRAERIERTLRALPGVTSADITWNVAREAARIRGKTGLPMPDSLILASTLAEEAQAFLTNDASFRGKDLPCRVFILDDFVN